MGITKYNQAVLAVVAAGILAGAGGVFIKYMDIPASAYGLMIGIGVYSLFFFGLQELKASKAAAIMYLDVVSTMLGDSLRLNMIVGDRMIILSSYLIIRN